jgi:hypothetical protein
MLMFGCWEKVIPREAVTIKHATLSACRDISVPCYPRVMRSESRTVGHVPVCAAILVNGWLCPQPENADQTGDRISSLSAGRPFVLELLCPKAAYPPAEAYAELAALVNEGELVRVPAALC